ncbi:signal peptidase I [Cellulomonas sp. DKR-3]|uniref:Signal peptidase I n=1 Tax=Cellulomonas fulva TaxID=2835530 RepID=A0ABS5TVI4_9CELL|nr:signal peptidase I [Cellulomonas fulva]MBT0993140.1 signal peptidase I [Cellulomonas fulva]
MPSTARRVLRGAGDLALTLVALLGLASLLVWGATQLGWIKPLVVVSGSMEPGIMTGDVLVAVPSPTADLRVGDVATIPNDGTGALVTHRVVAVEPAADGTWEVRMKGDANDAEDGGVYRLGDEVWTPRWQVPGVGYVLAELTRPAVAVPLVVAVGCLVALTLLPRTAPSAARAAAPPEPTDARTAAPAGARPRATVREAT